MRRRLVPITLACGMLLAALTGCGGGLGAGPVPRKGQVYEVVTSNAGALPATSKGELDRRTLKKHGYLMLQEGDRLEFTGDTLQLRLSNERLYLFEATELEEREGSHLAEKAPDEGDFLLLWASTVELFLEKD